ncbi:MAG: hypothetical protein HW406_2098 [Candidatus Brocadiaceae bacterium]|nr:hypothetical protein [Candidatus Brocadiaceae bacterium]
MVVKDGYRFIQGLISVRMHKELTKFSRELGQSNAQTVRDAIDSFLTNAKCKRAVANLLDEGAEDGHKTNS